MVGIYVYIKFYLTSLYVWCIISMNTQRGMAQWVDRYIDASMYVCMYVCMYVLIDTSTHRHINPYIDVMPLQIYVNNQRETRSDEYKAAMGTWGYTHGCRCAHSGLKRDCLCVWMYRRTESICPCVD